MNYPLAFWLDGHECRLEVEPRTTLAACLRSFHGRGSIRELCADGSCGACTVLLDGLAVKSCMVLALQADGRRVETLEGLLEADGARGESARVLLSALEARHASACGACRSGLVLPALRGEGEFVSSRPFPIEALTGTDCRCGSLPAMSEVVRETLRPSTSERKEPT